MNVKQIKPLITERTCPNCNASITFPDDVKTILCPKCRSSFRLYRENDKLQLRIPDRKDDLAVIQMEIENIEFEIGLLLTKVLRMEQFSFWVLTATLIPFGIFIWSLKSAFEPRGTWDEFFITSCILFVFLFVSYWLAFNPRDNRKIMRLQEERITLRHRMESL